MRYMNRSLSEGNVFVYLFLCFFPLFVWTNYSNITDMKMTCFLVLLGGFAVMVGFSFADKKKRVRQMPLPWDSYTPDFLLLTFLAGGLVSGLLSPYLSQVNNDGGSLIFLGAGRHDGWLFLAAYALLYFLASRFAQFKRSHLQAFTVVVFIMCLIGIIQLSGINFLALYPKSVYQGFPNRFFSTIGNADIMGGFMCMAAPIIGVGYVVFRLSTPMKIFFLLAHTISIYLMMCLQVDMAIVGLVALIVVMTPLLLRNRQYLKKLLDIGMTIAIGWGLTGLIQYKYVKAEKTTYTSIQATNVFWLCLAVFALLLIVRFLVEKFEIFEMKWLSYKVLRWSVVGVEIAAVIGAFCFLRFALEEPAKNGLLKDLYELVRGELSLTAGNHRIGIWKYSLMMAKENPVFGTGTGTFATTFKAFAKEAGYSRYANRNLDFAHNEYLHYICTMGLVGGISYVAFLLSAAWQALKRYLKNPKILVLGSAVFGYSVQVFFCFSVVIAAPFFWLFLGLMMGEVRATMVSERAESAKRCTMEWDSAE
ncbi:MAG: O-antigen ligase family protein [Clostridia bacterium]|nr:O-antigen ligase family protein [Clostridia bacterium]